MRKVLSVAKQAANLRENAIFYIGASAMITLYFVSAYGAYALSLAMRAT